MTAEVQHCIQCHVSGFHFINLVQSPSFLPGFGTLLLGLKNNEKHIFSRFVASCFFDLHRFFDLAQHILSFKQNGIARFDHFLFAVIHAFKYTGGIQKYIPLKYHASFVNWADYFDCLSHSISGYQRLGMRDFFCSVVWRLGVHKIVALRLRQHGKKTTLQSSAVSGVVILGLAALSVMKSVFLLKRSSKNTAENTCGVGQKKY